MNAIMHINRPVKDNREEVKAKKTKKEMMGDCVLILYHIIS